MSDELGRGPTIKRGPAPALPPAPGDLFGLYHADAPSTPIGPLRMIAVEGERWRVRPVQWDTTDEPGEQRSMTLPALERGTAPNQWMPDAEIQKGGGYYTGRVSVAQRGAENTIRDSFGTGPTPPSAQSTTGGS